MEKFQTLSILEIVQLPQFESQLVQQMHMVPAHVQRRLRAFKTPTGLWSGERLAAEYRLILTHSSKQSSTVRNYISAVAATAASNVHRTLLEEAQKAAKKAAKKRAPKKPKSTD